jgi:hypothetical protein
MAPMAPQLPSLPPSILQMHHILYGRLHFQNSSKFPPVHVKKTALLEHVQSFYITQLHSYTTTFILWGVGEVEKNLKFFFTQVFSFAYGNGEILISPASGIANTRFEES